mgnify:CR=1 FL=1
MKFRIENRFRGITLADYEKLYFDEPFNEAMCKALGLQRTLVDRKEEGGRMRRVVRVSPDREIPGPVQKVLGGAKIEYTEHVDYALGSGRGTWKTISSLLTDKVDSQGSIAFAERAGHVERVVDGDIKVSIFGLGGLVEKFIVADVEKSYEKAAEFTQAWIDKGR